MSARRIPCSVVLVLASLAAAACGGADKAPSGLSVTDRVALAQKFQNQADAYATMGAIGASFTLDNAALSVLVGATPGTFAVTSNGLAAYSLARGAPLTATTAGSYQGLAMRLRFIDAGIDDTSDFVIGWRGGDNPTDLVFAEDLGSQNGGGMFIAPNAEWTATAVTFAFANLSAPNPCDIPSELLPQIGAFADFTCKVGTVSASFNISESRPTTFGTNTAVGSRSAAASVSGFPVVSIVYDFTNAP